MEICYSVKSFAGGTCGFSYREDRSCTSQVVPLHSCKKDIPSHLRRSNLGIEWSRGSNSRCRVPKEVSGHGKGRVKSIPKADREIGKRVSQIVLRTSGKLPPGAKLRVPSDLGLEWELVNRLPKIQTEAEFSILMPEHFVGFPPSGRTHNYPHGDKGPFRTNY